MTDWIRPFHDRAWQKRHLWQHLVGGAVWVVLLSLVAPTAGLPALTRLYWVCVIQGVWERYQREYDPTYPAWSGVADWVLTVAGAALTLAVLP